MSDLDLVSDRGRRRRGRRPRRPATRPHGCIAVAIALGVVLGLVAAVGVVLWRGADGLSSMFADPEDFSGKGSGSVTVEVAEGDSAGDIGVTLERQGVVASVEAFTDAAATDNRSLSIQPGFYELRREMSAQAALDLLVAGQTRVEKAVTIPEGLTTDETLTRLAEQTPPTAVAYRAAAERPADLGLPAYARSDVEGYLFPATYPLPPGVNAAEVLALMVDRFRQAAESIGLESRARENGLSPRQVVTIASLVQAEASRPRDFAKVAAVIYNRLDESMALELDSTVQYATGGTGVFTSAKERNDPSPYNTYRYRGLPPGPIGAPGELALEAALQPAGGDWTYFVTVDLRTGRTLFTDNYRRHLRNVDKLRRYCADSRQC